MSSSNLQMILSPENTSLSFAWNSWASLTWGRCLKGRSPPFSKPKQLLPLSPELVSNLSMVPLRTLLGAAFHTIVNNNSGGRNWDGEGFILAPGFWKGSPPWQESQTKEACEEDVAFPHILPNQETETALAVGSGFYPQEPDSSNLSLPKCATTSKTVPPSENQMFQYVNLWGAFHIQTMTRSHPQIAYTPKEFQDIGSGYIRGLEKVWVEPQDIRPKRGTCNPWIQVHSNGMVLTRESFSQFFLLGWLTTTLHLKKMESYSFLSTI